jgi:hypothetical protein
MGRILPCADPGYAQKTIMAVAAPPAMAANLGRFTRFRPFLRAVCDIHLADRIVPINRQGEPGGMR